MKSDRNFPVKKMIKETVKMKNINSSHLTRIKCKNVNFVQF